MNNLNFKFLFKLPIFLSVFILIEQPTHGYNARRDLASIPNLVSRLDESILLRCGESEHELLKQLEATEPGMPVLVNWFKHYSLTRRSDKPIYAKYLANNIDYAPHISKDYESRLQVLDKINLNISSLKATDEALYECRLILFDKAYADSQTGSMFYLQVYVAPEFEYPNEEIVYFNPNVPIRLYCYAKGKPTPTISWYKNEQKLSANTSVLQEYTSLQDVSADIFEYRCEAENQIGKIEHTVRVIRSGSLFFTQPLRNLTINEGTILNWPCLAQSNAEVTYKWFRNSVSVELGLHKWSDRGALFQDGMLYLLQTYRNDSGIYECHAYTNNKRIETKAYLNIQYGPEIENFQSPYYAVENSQSIVLDCVVTSNPSISALEWFKDKYLLSNTNKYQILSNNSLLIRNIQKADRGNYYCSCNNTIKKAVSSVINLEIVDPALIDETDLVVIDNEEYKIPCKYRLDKSVKIDEIEWFKLNSPLPKNRIAIDSNGSLVLNNIQTRDSGVYFCKIVNGRLDYDEFVEFLNLKVSANVNKYISTKSYDSTSKNIKPELPICPLNIKINATGDGILIKWTHPSQEHIKIEYYQIYYRQIGITKTRINDWKTTESINPHQDNYLIDTSRLDKSKSYEMQMVSFTSYSKSLPSPKLNFKINPRPAAVNRQSYDIHHTEKPVTYDGIATDSSQFYNLSQLDMILILIFLALLLMLLISIIACILYQRSAKKRKIRKENLKNDLDDWGFQSSAATATFLSSSASSSERSFALFNKNKKTKYDTAADSDVITKIIDKNKDEDMNPYSNLYSNQKILEKTSYPLFKSQQNKSSRLISPKPKPKVDYFSPTNTDKINNKNLNYNNSSSGIQSCEESDESIQNVPIRTDGFLTVNTIKYNAKTNMVQQHKFSAKSLNSAKKNVINEESEGSDTEKTDPSSSLLNNSKNSWSPKYNTSPKSSEYYHWVNENTNSESLGSETYSPNSMTPPLLQTTGLRNNLATLSTSSTDSSQTSPPFPVGKHILTNYGSSLTMVSTKIPQFQNFSANSPSSSATGSDSLASTSSGCSSYESKNMKSLTKVNRAHFDQSTNGDYENFKTLPNTVISQKKYGQFPVYKSNHSNNNNTLGTFKTKRLDYV